MPFGVSQTVVAARKYIETKPHTQTVISQGPGSMIFLKEMSGSSIYERFIDVH